MKLSVFTVATPDLTPEELAKAAVAAGITGIEWRFKDIPADAVNETPSFWRNNLCSIDPAASDAELDRFEQAALNENLVNLSITPYLNDCNVAETEHVFKAAQKIGVPSSVLVYLVTIKAKTTMICLPKQWTTYTMCKSFPSSMALKV